MKEEDKKIFGYYKESIDHFLCVKCFSEARNINKKDYKEIKKDDLEENIYTCDECGRKIDIEQEPLQLKNNFDFLIGENLWKRIKKFLLFLLDLRNLPRIVSVLIALALMGYFFGFGGKLTGKDECLIREFEKKVNDGRIYISNIY